MDIYTLLGSYAFPIAACFAMAIFIKEIQLQHREDMREMNKQHKEEIGSLRVEFKTAIDNNTKALQILTNMLRKGE